MANETKTPITDPAAKEGLVAGWQYWMSYCVAIVGLALAILGPADSLQRGVGVALFIGAFFATFVGYRKQKVAAMDALILGAGILVITDWMVRTLFLLRGAVGRKSR